MNTIFEDYAGGLKMAFARACEGTHISEWGMSSTPALDKNSHLVCDFTNERTKMVLHVVYEGLDDTGNNQKFSVQGSSLEMNMSVPTVWKGLKFH